MAAAALPSFSALALFLWPRKRQKMPFYGERWIGEKEGGTKPQSNVRKGGGELAEERKGKERGSFQICRLARGIRIKRGPSFAAFSIFEVTSSHLPAHPICESSWLQRCLSERGGGERHSSAVNSAPLFLSPHCMSSSLSPLFSFSAIPPHFSPPRPCGRVVGGRIKEGRAYLSQQRE